MITPFAIFSQNKFNLDFDDIDPEKKIMPAGWFKWGYYDTLAAEKISDGNYAGKIVSDSNGPFGCIMYRIPANFVGDTIRLTGRIKHENVKGFVGLLMRIDGHSKNGSLAFESMQKLKIKGTNDWKEYSIKLPYPSNAKTIYVGGILGKRGTAWFDDFKVTIDGNDIQTLEEIIPETLESYDPIELQSAIAKSSEQLDLTNQDGQYSSLDSLILKVGDKKIVAIGENTHGTSEFYRLREIITKRLIKEKGFNLIILENPYDDIELLNRDLFARPLDSLIQKHLFSIYQTEEMKSFLKWYKDNHKKYDVKFKGCDDSYWVYHELLDSYINIIGDEKLNKLLKQLGSNLQKTSTTDHKKQRKSRLSVYNNIVEIENYLESINKLTPQIKEILLNGKNTNINYVNNKNNKPIQSRDEIMADRISYLTKDKDNKAIVWAHNAHISKEIIVDNEIGVMGRDLKQEFGNDYHAIGLVTLKGKYTYIDEKIINSDHIYTDKLEIADFQPQEELFWENLFALNGNSFYMDMSLLKKELKTDGIIGPTKLVGYSKESKGDIYFLPIIQNFDSLIFMEKTNATTPIFN